MNHSKEPWSITDPHIVGGEDGGDLVAAWNVSQSTADANARRIVACVNFCREVSNEYLDRNSLEKMARAFEEATAQRDELLAALKAVWIDCQLDLPGVDELIAKVEANK